MTKNAAVKGLIQALRGQYTTSRLTVFALILFSVIYAEHAINIINYPGELQYGEGFLLNSAIILANGQNIYPPLSDHSGMPSFYPPVYTLLYAVFIKIFGISLAAGRIIAAASTVISACLIYAIVESITKRRIISAAAGVAFLVSPYVYAWSAFARVDNTALMFSLLGIFLAMKYEGNNKLYASVPFFVLSVYTKQTYIAAPIATFIYLLINGRSKKALRFISFFAFTAAAVFLTINQATAGLFYTYVINGGSTHGFSVEQMLTFYLYLFRDCVYFILFLTATALAAEEYTKKRFRLTTLYFIFASLLTVTVGSAGAALNYFIEAIAAGSILFGLAADRITKNTQSKPDIKSIICLMLILGLFFSILLDYEWYSRDRDRDAAAKDYEALSSIIKNANGPILSEDASLLVLNNRSGDIFEFFALSRLSEAGLWNQSELINEIRSQRFEEVILHIDVTKDTTNEPENYRFTKEMIEEIRNKYVSVEMIGDETNYDYRYYVYRPKE